MFFFPVDTFQIRRLKKSSFRCCRGCHCPEYGESRRYPGSHSAYICSLVHITNHQRTPCDRRQMTIQRARIHCVPGLRARRPPIRFDYCFQSSRLMIFLGQLIRCLQTILVLCWSCILRHYCRLRFFQYIWRPVLL